MLHLNSSCISNIEHIERALKRKDYEGIRTSAEIRSVFENLGEAFKTFSDSLKRIHSDGNAIIANIKKRHTDEGHSDRVYFADCFVNVVTLVQNLYEQNLSISKKIRNNILLELEKEEAERAQEISSIYEEADTGSTTALNGNGGREAQEDGLSTGERWEYQTGSASPHDLDSHDKGIIIHVDKAERSHKEDYNHNDEVLVDGIPLREIEIDLKRCLENEHFAKEYLNSAKYKKHFSELDKLNIKLDKEIDALKVILDKFGKNANKLLINKSKERINAIQIRKKNILEILYDNIKELRHNKRTMRCSIKDLEQYVQDNHCRRRKWQDKEGGGRGRGNQNGDATKEEASPHNLADQKGNKKTLHRLNLEKFEIREKHRIEKIYTSVRGFIKILAVEHIHMNTVLHKGACEISSYDSLIDYQMWLSLVLRKDVNIADLQQKIPKNDVLTEEEQFRLMPHRGDSPTAGAVHHTSEKKRKTKEQNFQSGELICSESSSPGAKAERKKQKDLDLKQGGEAKKEQALRQPRGGDRAASPRDGQFPEQFYIPMIIERRSTYRSEEDSRPSGEEARGKEEKGNQANGKPARGNRKTRQALVNPFVGEKNEAACLSGKPPPREEKDIFSFLINRQKECEKYMLQFNRVDILSTMLSGRTKDKRRWYDQNFFQGYFFEEGHPFYPFRIPPNINHFSTFEKWGLSASSARVPLFEEEHEEEEGEGMTEYEYKLLAYESLLLVYYSLSTQLNGYFLFDMSKRDKLNKEVYNQFCQRCYPMLETIQGGKKQTRTNAEEAKEEEEKERYKSTPPPGSDRRYTLNDHLKYVDDIYHVKLQNLLLVKRIISIFRIKLNLNSRANDLVTLLTIPSHDTNWGHTYTFHVLDVRFRIIRIMDSLNFNHVFHANTGKQRKKTDSTREPHYSEESTIYTSWLRRQLQLLHISVYLKFSKFVKFVPFFESHSDGHFKDVIDQFENEGEYFSYLSRGSGDKPFVSYLRNVQRRIEKLHWFVLHHGGTTKGVTPAQRKQKKPQQGKTDENKTDENKTDENKTDENKTDQNKTDGHKSHDERNDKPNFTNFTTFKSLRRDEQIIFLCNLLLKNLIKSFRLIYLLKSLVREDKWNAGVCDEKKKLANLVKYFTKIEYYDYEVRKIVLYNWEGGHDHPYQDQLQSKHPRSESEGEHKGECSPTWDGQNIDHDELYKDIFMKEFSKLVKTGSTRGIHSSRAVQGKTPPNETGLTRREKTIRSKIFYKLNIETILCSSWFIDRSLLHFFLYYYISCVIGTGEQTNMYADMPYLMQGIMLVVYYLQAGNDLALKGKTQGFNDGVEPTPIPISTFILYLGIHLFYSFFDKNFLTVCPNEDDGRVKLFLRTKLETHNDEKESKSNQMENYFPGITPAPRKSQIITVQNASQFYFVVKNFESVLSYRTVNEMDMGNGQKGTLGAGKSGIHTGAEKSDGENSDADLLAAMAELYADDSSGQDAKEEPNQMTKSSKKKYLFCATVPKDHDKLENPNSEDNLLQKKKLEKKHQNELIYLKRYSNILLHFNYNHLENLISPYVPNVLSLYGKDELYSKDHFFFDWYMKNDDSMEVHLGGREEKSRQVRFGSPLEGEESKREDSIQIECPGGHRSARNPRGSNTTSPPYDKQNGLMRTNEEVEKSQKWDAPTSSTTLLIRYRTNQKGYANFSLVNLSRIEKVMTDILLMRMISCDFRDHFILLLCNYRRFIDMYSLPYVLDVFVMLHRFFTINDNSSEEKSNRIKYYLHGLGTSPMHHRRLRGRQERNRTLFERCCNVVVHDLDDKEWHSRNRSDGTSHSFTSEEVIKGKRRERSSLTHGEISSAHELSSFFKFFIFNTVKNIFFNIVCIVREDIEASEMLKKGQDDPSESGEAVLESTGEAADGLFLRTQRDSSEEDASESGRGGRSSSGSDDDPGSDASLLNCTTAPPVIQNPLTNQYVDIINKYINEVVAEILFFSNIWKEYLSPKEHPLMVLFAANRTLYYEVSKFIGINKDNNEVLFSQALSIVVSLYNFNLLIKEIVLQSDTYERYQCLVNEKPLDDRVAIGGSLSMENSPDGGFSPVAEDAHRTSSPRRKMQSKIAKYYETRNSLKGSGEEEQKRTGQKKQNQEQQTRQNHTDDTHDRFINLSLIISNANDPCMVKLMFKLEKIFIQIMDHKLEHNKNLLSVCLEKEKLIPLNSPEVMYNSTSVDIFSIIWSILDVLFEYKCPVEWIITPFVQFLHTFINDYCENYKKKYTSFIISVMNQYADKYFQDLLNLTEQQKIQWDKFSRSNIRRNRKEGNKEDDEVGGSIFKHNELDMLDHAEEEEQDDLVLYNENIQNEFNDMNEVTERIKHRKRKKNVLYKLFDYDELDVNAIKNKVGELLEDINDLSVKVSPFQSNSPSKATREVSEREEGPTGTTHLNPPNEETNGVPPSEEKKPGAYMSDDLVNILDEINHLFDNSDMSTSMVITWNLFFFQEQVALIRNKFEKYILDYISARTQNVDKLSRIFGKHVTFNITLPMLQKNMYTKTILDILNTSISNIRDTLKNTLYFIFKVLSIRIVCYEFQQELFFNMYEEPFDRNNIQAIVRMFPNTVEKFILQIPESFRKNILTVFIELFIKMWILVVVEKGFSNYIFNDNDIHLMKRDNQCIRKYMQQRGIQLSHLFLTKKYDVTEYIDTFFDSLYGDRHLFAKILSEQKERRSKNIMSSAYNKGM
ncbi:hypothetical protein C922_01984 [Plasmodium inui San Antonio 1]|uniref:Uncharacterized protein n=1 Tax=Plasmodium inui San Antonio 1 TaxID=1237626 RepID=W7A7Z5_9APIC|nr:hypothetical protein C922_01984 [Plasmodium inui San Antonio 1]EUD67795.1 hypothetical protein C922_01984 [Plasmodium inui San Antonio 1]